MKLEFMMKTAISTDERLYLKIFEAAEQYFIGNAQALKKLEMVENSLRDNAKIVITEHGIHPTLLLGNPPVTMLNGNGAKLIKAE